MNLKRAIGVGLLTYLASFIIGIIIMFAMGVDPSQGSEIPKSAFIVNIIITLILAGLFTLFYFKDKKIKRSAKEGFMFGIVLIIIGFILDIIIFTLTSMMTTTQVDLLEYYSDPIFWLALILFVLTTTIVGAIKEKKKKR